MLIYYIEPYDSYIYEHHNGETKAVKKPPITCYVFFLISSWRLSPTSFMCTCVIP